VQHLQKLVDEASLEAAESTIADYILLVPMFVEGIAGAVAARDAAQALDVSLRLKTKSWLIGALRMNQLCSELELALALTEWASATTVVRDIELHLPRLQKALAGAPDLAFPARRPRALRTALAS
jgi:HPt (histidine-containing phosphotransfer) domain-containing protein